MRLNLSTRLLAGLTAAGALGAGVLLSPTFAQDAPKATTITLTGTAINPDGSPGASLPVAVKAPEKKLVPAGEGGGEKAPGMLSQAADKGQQDKSQSKEMLKVLAKGTTDAQGKFSLKFTPIAQGEQTVTLEIGDPTKGAWAKQQVVSKGKDQDLGNIQLKAAIKQ